MGAGSDPHAVASHINKSRLAIVKNERITDFLMNRRVVDNCFANFAKNETVYCC